MILKVLVEIAASLARAKAISISVQLVQVVRRVCIMHYCLNCLAIVTGLSLFFCIYLISVQIEIAGELTWSIGVCAFTFFISFVSTLFILNEQTWLSVFNVKDIAEVIIKPKEEAPP